MQIRPVPQQRIIEKMDEYMGRRDYAGAERHLLYWLEEAEAGQDLRGQLMLRNELIGHYRKTADREKAFINIEEALRLLKALQFEDSISAGTTYVNAATACSAFGENGRAMQFFERARGVYEAGEDTEPQLLGGLYNNMALACTALGKKEAEDLAASGGEDAERNAASCNKETEESGNGTSAEAWFTKASILFEKALEQMRLVPNGELEQAVTYLNMADLLESRDGPEAAEYQIGEYLDTASGLLRTPSVPRDGYYAFVCEKCAPAFSYYGFFLEAEELRKQAEKIYAENRDQTG